jgi:hypothetical protein
MVFDISISEGEESTLFSEGKNEKYQNGFFTIDYHGQDISRSILGFQIG